MFNVWSGSGSYILITFLRNFIKTQRQNNLTKLDSIVDINIFMCDF